MSSYPPLKHSRLREALNATLPTMLRLISLDRSGLRRRVQVPRPRQAFLAGFLLGLAWFLPCQSAPRTPQWARPKAVLQTTKTPGWGTTMKVRLGTKEVPFLFDTGGGLTVITPEAAKLIGCKPWGQVTGFRMTGQRVDMKRCDDAYFRVGDNTFLAPIAGVFQINDFAEGATTVLSGSFGLDIFAGETITIRPRAEEIVVETPASLQQRIIGARNVPIRLVRDAEGVALSVDVAVTTSAGLAWMELDTGNSGPIAVGKHIALLLGLVLTTKATQTANLKIPGGVAVQGSTRLGNLIMDGDIGAQILDGWDLTVDLQQGRAWIKSASPLKTSF